MRRSNDWTSRAGCAKIHKPGRLMISNEHAPLSDLPLLLSPPDVERLGAAVNCLSVPVLIVAADRTILAVNHALVRQIGYSRDELLRQPVAVVVPEGLSSPATPNQNKAQLATAPEARQSAAVAQRKDGSRFPVTVYMNWLSSREGTVGVAALIEISERVKSEARETARDLGEQRFRALADNVPAMIWTSGPDKHCNWCNRGWLEFVGQPLEHELDDGWLENVHPDDRAECLRTYEACFDAREPFGIEYRLLRHDREWRWVLDTAAPSVGADGVFEGYLGSCVDITEQKRAVQSADQSGDRLRTETRYLSRDAKSVRRGRPTERSAAIERVMEMIDQVAPTDSTVLLLGETGTGKEFLASRIHELSGRRNRSMVRVNCAAIPAALIESELFGRERGAFTGALSRQPGRFEVADHSTIFLDEIGDLPLDVQVKLLRVLEERQFERLGSSTPVRVDARIIAATHRNLEQRISEGTFREDLFYRLNVFPIVIPPLRERAEDIPALVRQFIDQFSTTLHRRFESISASNMAVLQAYPWPGNIRELRNVVERAMILATGERLTIALPEPTGASGSVSARLEDIERDHIRRVLDATAWRIRGTGGAADRLGLAPTTLESRMTKLGLTRPSASV